MSFQRECLKDGEADYLESQFSVNASFVATDGSIASSDPAKGVTLSLNQMSLLGSGTPKNHFIAIRVTRQ
jgi:hypothetical protein